MEKAKKKIWSVIVTFVAFLAAALLSFTLTNVTKALAATGDIPYLAPVYDTHGKVTFAENGNVVMRDQTLADGR